MANDLSSINVNLVGDFNDQQYMNMLGKNNVRLANFKYRTRVSLSSTGQSVAVDEKIAGTDFLVRDIEIHGYDCNGSLLGIGFLPRDRFTLMMSNLTTGDNFFNGGVDVGHFTPLKNSGQSKITPQILKAGTVIGYEIKHDSIVSSGGGVEFNPTVDFEIILSGAKIFPNN